ncbi:TetR/AcrR family transcriptional regulator [Microbacterium sp. MMO-79]|uniref:TetR/AcrR family transcriptional regulator n=1 Tax=Microbacterium sp. MMO-79 TaxID=3081285 RepID=UPI0030172857
MQRSDARRSRERILQAARSMPPDDLRLNAVANAAGVGVGTVYRHFATVESLQEALALDQLEQMAERARRAADAADTSAEAPGLILDLARMQFEHEGVRTALLAADPAPETERIRTLLRENFHSVLDAAVAAGTIRPDVTVEQIQHLICGMEYTIRLTGPQHRDTVMSVLINGLRPLPTL